MIDIVKNAGSDQLSKPVISVLVPYYRDDPSMLFADLQAEAQDGVEILFYDDGTGDADTNSKMSAMVKSAATPCKLLLAKQNKGRSAARNTLVEHAQADWVLFLDADMRPDTDNFLGKYLNCISSGNADVIFGGFTVPDKMQSADTELHRAFSQTSDCLTAEDRQKNGPQYVCSSNLCVRKSALKSEPFDTGFSGWGWEDSEWAARISKVFTILHADIPALHLGLESTETLLSRFKSSGANYMRFTNAHPEVAKTLTLYKTSRLMGRLPGQSLLRPILSGLVRMNTAPIKLRLLALKFWRASWYAEGFAK